MIWPWDALANCTSPELMGPAAVMRKRRVTLSCGRASREALTASKEPEASACHGIHIRPCKDRALSLLLDQ